MLYPRAAAISASGNRLLRILGEDLLLQLHHWAFQIYISIHITNPSTIRDQAIPNPA